jgi:hypothetical protein
VKYYSLEQNNSYYLCIPQRWKNFALID